MGQQVSHPSDSEENDRRYGPSTLCLSPITSNDSGEAPSQYQQLMSSIRNAAKNTHAINHHIHSIDESIVSHSVIPYMDAMEEDIRNGRQKGIIGHEKGIHERGIGHGKGIHEKDEKGIHEKDEKGIHEKDEKGHEKDENENEINQHVATPIEEINGSFEENPSLLVQLPLEILYRIIELVYYDENSASINANLESFSKTIPLLSRKINQLSLCFLYKYAIFNRPHAFDKFLRNLEKHEAIGRYVEYMDFSQFTSIGLGRTGRMNMEIQMVTSKTIEHALSLCPFLLEFLASENIQDDISVGVLDFLFNKLEKIQALDFCGASSESFVHAFNMLQVSQDLETLTKVSFHDCSSLPVDVFAKILPRLVNLRRLDLNHSRITSTALFQHLSPSARLTHLSLARCSKLTTKDLIFLLTKHPALTCGALEWLNLQIDMNVVSPLSDTYLLFTVQQLVAPKLQYLNLGGMPITSKVLTVIKAKFQLTSLVISHANIVYDELLSFIKAVPSLRFLDCTGVKCLNKSDLIQLLRLQYDSNLCAIEFDYKTLFELTSRGSHVKISRIQTSFVDAVQAPHVWKFYDNEGRRAWIYRMDESDPESKRILSASTAPVFQSNLVYYDLETGNKIVTKVKKPDFLKYASRKINCSIGYHNLKSAKRAGVECVWPVEFSQRGIYNYYSLNVK